MDTSKIKNLLIIILLLLNAFLLAAVCMDRAESRQSREETANELRKVLSSNGITAAAGLDFFPETPSRQTLIRDAEAELDKVEGILGKCAVQDLGGNIYYYSSEDGQASFRGTGELDILFDGDEMTFRGKPEKAVEKLLKGAGIDTDGDSAAVTYTEEGGRVELCCLWDGCPIYNARLSVDFSQDFLLMVSGSRPFDRQLSSSDEGVMDCASVVLRFVEIVRSDGYICSRLEDIQAGYIMSVTVSGECSLVPVWRFKTDTGTLYINAVSGKTETL